MRKNIRRTGKRRTVTVIALAMLLGMTGCAGKAAAPETTQENVSAEGEMQEEVENGSETDDSDSTKEDLKEPEDERQTVSLSQGTEHLGGKVQDPQADGMTFAQTTLVDEDGMVTLLDVKDAKKIPVKFTEDTKVEHWTIQGGGAGIDMQNAAVSDLIEGMGVELEGYFDGETFVATKVIIEDYV